MTLSLLTGVTNRLFILLTRTREIRTTNNLFYYRNRGPRRLCHLSIDGLVAPYACLDDVNGKGYNPLWQRPLSRGLFVA
jgi:hypothetical protein